MSFVTVLTPCFSKYQILESGIINIYLNRALGEAGMQNATLLNLVTDTPYMLYQVFGLYNPQQLTPSNLTLGQQQTLLILAFTSVLLYNISRSAFVFVCGNGPVVNTGFATLLGIATAMGVPVVYWKDDARHLWGFNDNPMMIGTLPTINTKLLNPPHLPIRLAEYKRNDCGPDILPGLIRDAMASQTTRATPSSHIQKYIQLGQSVDELFRNNSEGITYQNSWTESMAEKTFTLLKNLVESENTSQYMSSADSQYILAGTAPRGALSAMGPIPQMIQSTFAVPMATSIAKPDHKEMANVISALQQTKIS